MGLNRDSKGKWKGGRPHTFSRKVGQDFVRILRSGCYFETACDAIGVRRNSVRRWLNRGMKPHAEIDEPEFAEFATNVHKAIAEAEHRAIANVRAAAEAGNWKAEAWFLERRHRDRWGQSIKLSKEAVEKAVSELSDQEISDLADQIASGVPAAAKIGDGDNDDDSDED